jgi:hypothetical protein
MTRKTDVFTVEKSRTILAKLVKVANDLVDVAAAAPEESGAGSAGPQEVVDALEVVIDELSQVQEAIPAEPSNGSPEEGVPVEEAPVDESPVEAPVAEESEEEEPKLAKQVKSLTAQLDKINREKVATQFAELFDEPKVQQAKYDEVLNSKDSLATWTAKIDSIEQYKQHEGASSPKMAKADNMTSWINKSKFAKQSDEMMSL